MRVPGLVLLLMSLAGAGGCFIAPPYVFEPEPEPTQPLSDAGSPGPGDAGVSPQADAGGGLPADAGDPLSDTRPPADPSCPIDPWENDDSLEQSRYKRSFEHGDGYGPTKLAGLTACLEDEDWFRTFTDAGTHDPVGAIVRWDATVGPLEVDLVDRDGVRIPLTDPKDIVERRPGEVTLLRKKTGGAVFIRVRASGAVSVPYSIDIYSPFFFD